MTITHDTETKSFANGRLAQEMQDFASVKWYRDKPAEPPPLSFPEIHSRLKYIQEQLNYGRCSIDYIAAQRHFQEVESKLQELIERVK